MCRNRKLNKGLWRQNEFAGLWSTLSHTPVTALVLSIVTLTEQMKKKLLQRSLEAEQ